MALALLFFAALLDYKVALPGYRYQFPRDHFSHPDYRTEWWYYTGNLRARDGHRYGFELVFFRQGQDRRTDANPSAWRIDDLYVAHLALTDIDSARFRYWKRLNRAGPGIAGRDPGEWAASGTVTGRCVGIRRAARQTLHRAGGRGELYPLSSPPPHPPVIEGENGVSQKAAGVGRASYYVSFPRINVTGRG